MQRFVERRSLLRAGSVFVTSLLAGCGHPFGAPESTENDRYVGARVVDEKPENREVVNYSDERVQKDKYARELIPKAVNGNGIAERKVPDDEENLTGDLPSYIIYKDQIVHIYILVEE